MLSPKVCNVRVGIQTSTHPPTQCSKSYYKGNARPQIRLSPRTALSIFPVPPS